MGKKLRFMRTKNNKMGVSEQNFTFFTFFRFFLNLWPKTAEIIHKRLVSSSFDNFRNADCGLPDLIA